MLVVDALQCTAAPLTASLIIASHCTCRGFVPVVGETRYTKEHEYIKVRTTLTHH